MFTGLVKDIGEIVRITRAQEDMSMRIRCALPVDSINEGASICCSGCCLTVTDKGEDWFQVDISAESLSKTWFGNIRQGDKVNLEPSLKMGEELGGHFVFGHVDALTKLTSINREGESWRLRIAIPEGLDLMIASKGSVALDGISLTVNEAEKKEFGVNIIPHTWQNTTLQYKKEGDFIHFEADMLARYVARRIKGVANG